MTNTERAVVDAAACQSMEQVRAEIDRIDRRLVALMAERQRYIEAAARIKEHEIDIRLEWRIEEVLSKVLAAAEREGLSKSIAESVWREMMDRCIEHERAAFLARRGGVKKAS